VLALSARELLVVYAIPIAAVVAVWLIASASVFGLAHLQSASMLAADLRRRVEERQRTRSGRNVRLSFGYVALSLAGDNCVQATVLHRVASSLARRRLGALARAVQAFSKFLTNIDISPRAEIGPGLYLYHGLGTVIGKGSKVGSNVLICQNVTLGGGPTIGDGVRLWAGAKVVGRVTIGDRAEIGANGVVVADVPPDTIAVGVPATRHLRKRSSSLPDLDD
jgi:serine O-acetyltransferase